jgi:hypothetical protein
VDAFLSRALACALNGVLIAAGAAVPPAGAQPLDPTAFGGSVVGVYTAGLVSTTPTSVDAAAGRAEVLFGDGTLLHVDADTRVRWVSGRALALDDGRVLVRTGTAGWAEVALPDGRVTLAPGGTYGVLVDAEHERVLVSVGAGRADVESSRGAAAVPLQAMQLVVLTGPDSRPVPTAYVPATWDTFLQWSAARSAELAAAAGAPTRAEYTPRTIPLGRGGAREPTTDAASATALSYGGGEAYACCGGGIGSYGYPVWGYGFGYGYGRGHGMGKWRDPYAPDFAPDYDPHFGPGFGPGGHRGGRNRPGEPGVTPIGPQPPPSRVELPPLTVSPPSGRGPALALPAPSAPGKSQPASAEARSSTGATRSTRAPARAMPRSRQ